MDQISAMNAFVRVVDAGTFTKAAETLDVPKATVTRLVQGLEAHLHVRLLHRTTRSLTLTAEGATYYERVVRLLRDIEDINSSARSALGTPAGRINIAASVSLGSVFLVPALKEFFNEYPDIEVALSVTNRDVDLVAENFDCAIRIGAISNTSLVARRVGGFRFVTCASPEYLGRHGTPTHPDDLLQGHSCIGYISERVAGTIAYTFHKDGQRFEFQPPTKFLVNDTNAQLTAAVSGIGVMQAPSFSVRAAIESGQLVPILDDWLADVRPMSVIYPPNRYLSAKVRVFVDWLVALVARNPHLSLRESRETS